MSDFEEEGRKRVLRESRLSDPVQLLRGCRDAMTEAMTGMPTDWTHMIAAIDGCIALSESGTVPVPRDLLTIIASRGRAAWPFIGKEEREAFNEVGKLVGLKPSRVEPEVPNV
jgi:hypothetical protein